MLFFKFIFYPKDDEDEEEEEEELEKKIGFNLIALIKFVFNCNSDVRRSPQRCMILTLNNNSTEKKI